MRVAFRVDASLDIGTGHVARCMALADELVRRGAEVVFVMRETSGHLCEVVDEAGFPVRRLPEGLRAGGQQDFRATARVLHNDHPFDWLIVDHYEIDSSWESEVRRFASKVMVIDDLADRRHNCDLLLDQNFPVERRRYEGIVPTGCDVLLGPRYALLRSEFRQFRCSSTRKRSFPPRVFISFGGVDLDNLSGKALDSLSSPEFSDVEVAVVAGSGCPHLQELSDKCARRPQTEFHVRPNNIAQIMASAQIAVGAAGTSAWERCCLGLPAVLVVIAPNQERASTALGDAGMAINLGWKDGVSTGELRRAVTELLDPKRAAPMRERCMSLVDGLGASRIADALFAERTREEANSRCA